MTSCLAAVKGICVYFTVADDFSLKWMGNFGYKKSFTTQKWHRSFFCFFSLDICFLCSSLDLTRFHINPKVYVNLQLMASRSIWTLYWSTWTGKKVYSTTQRVILWLSFFLHSFVGGKTNWRERRVILARGYQRHCGRNLMFSLQLQLDPLRPCCFLLPKRRQELGPALLFGHPLFSCLSTPDFFQVFF